MQKRINHHRDDAPPNRRRRAARVLVITNHEPVRQGRRLRCGFRVFTVTTTTTRLTRLEVNHAVVVFVNRGANCGFVHKHLGRVDSVPENKRLGVARQEPNRRARPQLKRVRGFRGPQGGRGPVRFIRKVQTARVRALRNVHPPPPFHRAVQKTAEPAAAFPQIRHRNVILVQTGKELVVLVQARETPRAVDQIQSLGDALDAFVGVGRVACCLLRGCGCVGGVTGTSVVHEGIADRQNVIEGRSRGCSGGCGLRIRVARNRIPRRARPPHDVLNKQTHKQLSGPVPQHLGRRAVVQTFQTLKRGSRATRVPGRRERLGLAHHNLRFHARFKKRNAAEGVFER
mmetsp:Transcript_12218/g.40604  ORF Transcript_12218/g.40604 Transcript_12218/m.40604 type:complete len:343 (+) Transcript_12218:304-1332(+)